LTLTDIAKTETSHFMKCPACAQWFDMRDLAQVIAQQPRSGTGAAAGSESAALGADFCERVAHLGHMGTLDRRSEPL
jgi:hypothetical protein